MVSEFTGAFGYYLPPSETAVKVAMTTGLVVLDTNVLLSAYRFAPEAREELFSALERVANRIWIPNQVAEEFHRNRLEVISDNDAAYVPVIDSLRSAQAELNDSLRPKIAELSNRAALSDDARDGLLRLVETSMEAAMTSTEELRRAHALGDLRASDGILARFQGLFNGKTGAPFTETELNEATAEAKRRIDSLIPPGYRDAKKPMPYGDYFVWRQTLAEVAERKPSHLVFVTSDTKPDWYLIIKGRTVSAQPRLAKEVMDTCDGQLVMMSTGSFLFHAKQYLDAKVSDETLRQSQTLRQSSMASQKVARQNERAKQRLADKNRIATRIGRNAALIDGLRQLLDDGNLSDQEIQAHALHDQLLEKQRSQQILMRRLSRLEAEEGRDGRVHRLDTEGPEDADPGSIEDEENDEDHFNVEIGDE